MFAGEYVPGPLYRISVFDTSMTNQCSNISYLVPILEVCTSHENPGKTSFEKTWIFFSTLANKLNTGFNQQGLLWNVFHRNKCLVYS